MKHTAADRSRRTGACIGAYRTRRACGPDAQQRMGVVAGRRPCNAGRRELRVGKPRLLPLDEAQAQEAVALLASLIVDGRRAALPGGARSAPRQASRPAPRGGTRTCAQLASRSRPDWQARGRKIAAHGDGSAALPAPDCLSSKTRTSTFS